MLTDSDRARGHWHYCLSTCWNLLLSSSLSVLIPSDFIAAFFFISVPSPYLYFSPLLFVSLYPSLLLNLILQTLWKYLLEETVVWQLDLLVSWRKSICTVRFLEQRPSPMLPAECPPSSNHMRLLPKTKECTDHWYQRIQMYAITSNSMATFRVEQSPRGKDVQLTTRLFCFSAPLTPHFLSFPTCFFILISFFSFFFSSSSFFSSCFVLWLLESTFLPLGQAHTEYQCQKIK